MWLKQCHFYHSFGNGNHSTCKMVKLGMVYDIVLPLLGGLHLGTVPESYMIQNSSEREISTMLNLLLHLRVKWLPSCFIPLELDVGDVTIVPGSWSWRCTYRIWIAIGFIHVQYPLKNLDVPIFTDFQPLSSLLQLLQLLQLHASVLSGQHDPSYSG